MGCEYYLPPKIHVLLYTVIIMHVLQTLLNPVSSPYQQLSEDCVKYGVAVEMFLFPTSYVDVATLGSFASTTGGELHFYNNFTVC